MNGNDREVNPTNKVEKRRNSRKRHPKKASNKDEENESQCIPKPVTISPYYRETILSYINSIPKFQYLDSITLPTIQLYDNLIENYFASTKFHKHPKLRNPHHLTNLKKGIEAVYGRKSILFCIDVEAWEFNPKLVTEIGISIYDPRDQLFSMCPSVIQIHIMIKENINRKNGRFVPDHSKNFNGGITYVMVQNEAVVFAQSLVEYYFSKPKPGGIECCLVGHDIGKDISWFKDLGIKFPPNPKIVDTQSIYSLSHGSCGSSLKNALRTVNLPYAFLHNAGNDAYYTLLLSMKLCDPNVRLLYSLDDIKMKKPVVSSSIESADQNQLADPAESRKAKKRHKHQHNISEFIEISDVIEMFSTLFVVNSDKDFSSV